MEPVLQSGRRKARPWTAQDQITAEVAAACGVSIREIGLAIHRSRSVVNNRLVSSAAKKTSEASRRWNEANRERMREASRRYRKAKPESVRASYRRWLEQNLDKERARKHRYRAGNSGKIRQAIRRWVELNPEKKRDNVRRRATWRRAARRAALHPVTRAQIDARFAIWGDRCAFCGADATHQRNHGRQRLTVEHVLALTKGGLDEASNIIPACTACNSSKNNSPIEDWYRKQPFFTEARWRKICRHCPGAVIGQLPLAMPPSDTEAA